MSTLRPGTAADVTSPLTYGTHGTLNDTSTNTTTTEIRSRGLSFSANESQLTHTLLTLTTLFVLLNLPQYIVRLITAFAFDSNDYERPLWFYVFDYVSWLLYYLHYAILFYLYIFWTPKMRKQVRPTAMKLLECYCMKPVSDTAFD